MAGILIGGAMAATSLTGRRMVEAVGGELAVIEARLAARRHRAGGARPDRRGAVSTGLIP